MFVLWHHYRMNGIFLSITFKMYFVHLEMFLILIAEERKCAIFFSFLFCMLNKVKKEKLLKIAD